VSLPDFRDRKMKTVTIIYRFMPQYRVDFFNGLRTALRDRGIYLDVIYGKNSSVPRKDEVDLLWATAVKNRTFQVGLDLCWQPLPGRIRKSDLLILMQENKMLNNYGILLQSRLSGQRLAFWDHGRNLQAEPGSLGNRFKRMYSSRVHWWFAYTQRAKQIVQDMGFPEDRITVVENAIDTVRLLGQARAITPQQLQELKLRLGIVGGPVGIYCGGIYSEKRLRFLFSACEAIRQRMPGFEMIFLGAGPDAPLVSHFCCQHAWAHYAGPVFGDARIPYFKLADVFLMPGLVGLAILDAFALETPIVTTNYPHHGPEIEYLRHGENGVCTENTLSHFVEGVLMVVSSEEVKARLTKGCRASALYHTLGRMVNNFAGGVSKALDWQPAHNVYNCLPEVICHDKSR